MIELMNQGERACLEKCTSVECLLGIEKEIRRGVLELSCEGRGRFQSIFAH